MLRYTVICLTLVALSTAASPASRNDRRSARSIWPFGRSEVTTEDPIITEEHQRLMEEAGLGKDFNFSSHPLWKVHKYQGIDLKPVHVQTEIIPATSPKPEVAVETTTEPADLSFLDDLGGLAWFLPEPKDNEGVDVEDLGDVDEATDLITDAIKEDEEKEQPGFFKGLWKKIAAGPSRLYSSIFGESKEVAVEGRQNEANDDDDDSTTIFLPETEGNYVVFVVPSSATPTEELLPSSSVNQFAPAEQTAEGSVPPPKLPDHYLEVSNAPQVPAHPAHPNYHKSESWVQSWTPHANYSVHIKGEPIDINNNLGIPGGPRAERKIGQDDEIEGSTDQPQEEVNKEKNQENNEMMKELLKLQENGTLSTDDLASLLNKYPKEEITKYVQVKPSVLTRLLHDKPMKAQAIKNLIAKQPEFESNWKQVQYAYPRVRKQNHETTTIITTGDES